ncbi:sulfite exporter TauE/SafE family protein [Bradyrhizobium sp. CCBAU 51753]|uniref:sulfite exporter TauE/SafE family protein n=1 Tax=Bradyrhizobium sp. CCBAU 51753 TaxID=1325100 RepID=UPI00188B0C2A|nr:sulfite exporter TauE/SafE family protein [Bradyrhizobium sp. CCBAU 51753]QOZ29138.1 sulfite exporter TauE/SafE family protein [Bradyrhizobium sp. CCBAU 51753]
MHDLLAGIATGLAGGLTAGLLGVSPGGGLVVFSVLLLGAGQHVAQGISLVAQVPPTSLAGIRRYWQSGNRTPLRWIALLTIGFVTGGAAGALAANHVAGPALRWSYVAYLVALDAMLILRGGRDKTEDDDAGAKRDASWPALLVVGLLAGLSSGFLGIGGGLATVVGLSAVLGVPQHQAQMASLVMSLIPTTIPSAWIYWSEGSLASWPVLTGVIIGLLAGTDLGARAANRIDRTTLRSAMIFFVSLMALYMTFKALW